MLFQSHPPKNDALFSLGSDGELNGFDVGFVVHVPPHQLTNHHTNRGFGDHGTVPDDMKHDGTPLWTRALETAALPTEPRCLL